MLEPLISKCVQDWLAQADCPAKPYLAYMQARGQLREVQIQALQTYLFLLLRGRNKSLAQLWAQGREGTQGVILRIKEPSFRACLSPCACLLGTPTSSSANCIHLYASPLPPQKYFNYLMPEMALWPCPPPAASPYAYGCAI